MANAVFEQADAIMPSGETAAGRHPAECVWVMDRIAQRIERSGGANYHEAAEMANAREMLVRSAVMLADQLKAAAPWCSPATDGSHGTPHGCAPGVPIYVFFRPGQSVGKSELPARGCVPSQCPPARMIPPARWTEPSDDWRVLGRVRTGIAMSSCCPTGAARRQRG